MRTDELFINDDIVDLGDKTKITLRYKSNMFTDLSKIVSNNSYSIKLPPTVHNQVLIDHSDLPARVSDFPRKKHKVRYFRNGIEVLESAIGILMTIADTYDIALTWGNIESFANLVADNRKLNELPDNGENLLWYGDQPIANYNSVDSYFYSYYNPGITIASNTPAWYHPVVRVEWLIKKIEDLFNLKVNIPIEYNSFIRRLIIPCLTRKESDKVMSQDYVGLMYTGATYYRDSRGLVTYLISFFASNTFYGYTDKITVDRRPAQSVFIINRTTEKTSIYINAMFLTNATSGDVGLTITRGIREGEQRKWTGKLDGTINSAGSVIFNGSFQVDTEEGDYFYVDFGPGNDLEILGTPLFILRITPQAVTDIQFGMHFPIIKNLPDIKVLDFLKSIFGMCALFAVPQKRQSVFYSAFYEYNLTYVGGGFTIDLFSLDENGNPVEFVIDRIDEDLYDPRSGEYMGGHFVDNTYIVWNDARQMILLNCLPSDGNRDKWNFLYIRKKGTNEVIRIALIQRFNVILSHNVIFNNMTSPATGIGAKQTVVFQLKSPDSIASIVPTVGNGKDIPEGFLFEQPFQKMGDITVVDPRNMGNGRWEVDVYPTSWFYNSDDTTLPKGYYNTNIIYLSLNNGTLCTLHCNGYVPDPSSSDNRDKIGLSNIEKIIGNIPKALDWTDRLIAATRENKPREMKFALDNFAQHNVMKYKDDDTVIGNYNSELIVEDETIDTTRDAVSLQFSATDESSGVARIPLYTIEEGNVKLNKVQPKIWLESSDNVGKSIAIFRGLEWSTLIDQYYKNYQEVIRRPIIIKERMLISEYELKNLDLTIPIYLAQYGKYYAIVDVKSEDNGISVCELLQL